MKVNQNSGSTNHKAFRLGLQYACTGLLIDLCKRPDDAGGMDEFYALALRELGFAGREIDAALIAEAIPKLLERGVDFNEMVEVVETEETIDEVGRHHC